MALSYFFMLVLSWITHHTLHAAFVDDGPRYFHIPTLEIMQGEVYVSQSDHMETTIAYASKGSDLHAGDYLTHADGIRILNGGLAAFLKSGDSEAIVPIVDEDVSKHGGEKLLGFVLMQVVTPRKLSTRRGDVVFDLEEGGPAPTMKLGNLVVGPGGIKSTSDPSYVPPPYGGGACLTGRDCYNYNGTCAGGRCACQGAYTGTYCQLNRPEQAAVSLMLKKSQQRKEQEVAKPVGATTLSQAKAMNSGAPDPLPSSSTLTDPPPPSGQLHGRGHEEEAGEEKGRGGESEEEKGDGSRRVVKKKKKTIAKKRPEKEEEGVGQVAPEPLAQPSRQADGGENEAPSNVATIDDLYGDGKPYPEPYTAGRLPANIQQERHKKRLSRQIFTYSVRYRSGPLGLVFDNKSPNSTIVEKVVKGGQSDISDVKEGDILLAVDQFNISTAPAKISQRILSTLPWPRILVFQSIYAGDDPLTVKRKISSRTFNASLLFPPTLTADFSFRIAEWTPNLDLATPLSSFTRGKEFCPLYRIKAPAGDGFGCNVETNEYSLPDAFNTLVEQSGYVDDEAEQASVFLSLLLQEAKSKGVEVEVRSLGVVKRGVCTFVEKARTIASNGGHLGLVINTEDEVIDMPSGKEQTGDCSVPLGMVKETEGEYLHLSARTNEIWALLGDGATNTDDHLSPSCRRLYHIVEDVVDKWPHTVPPLSALQVKQNKAPDQNNIRGLTEEGGRVAVGGENGWAFFDYHLAMFGPQEVPLGAHRLVMALPPFGCDPNAYTVRISGSIVAILRGGGCSFGIKVINAQKLGAKAVIIVNTDDMKTMRLMALPDEIPLIHIPCIMVSRRIQYYLEEQLRPFHPLGQHLISIQPTGVFGDYEQKNSLPLPPRAST